MMNCSADTFDLSDLPYPGETKLLKTLHPIDYVKITAIVLIMLGTFFGNISIIVVVALNKSMQRTMNIYISNLAVADLLVCSICMSSFLSKTLHENHLYLLGPVMCKLEHFGRLTFLTSSVLTLAAIACESSVAVLFPLLTVVSKKRTKLVITAVWLISIAASIPALFVKRHFTIKFQNFEQPVCGDNWPATWDPLKKTCVVPMWLPQFYYTFVSTTLFFLPVIIMTVTYSLILKRMSVSRPGERNPSNPRSNGICKKKAIKMIFTVLLVFMFCWIPLQVALLYDKYRSEQGPLPSWYLEVARVTEFLAYSNSCLNPIVYAIFTKKFRDNLLLLLRCKRRFGTSNLIRRFRQSLTTALSTSTKRTFFTSSTKRNTGTGGRKGSAVTADQNAIPVLNNKADPQERAEENGVIPEENDVIQEEEKITVTPV